jgi:hypothetical protein
MIEEMMSRYEEWKYLREHGQWRDGVPDWARDYSGSMNDMSAAVAVIEELAALATPAPLSDEPVAWYIPDDKGNIYQTTGYAHEAAQWKQIYKTVLPLYAAPIATPSDKQEAVAYQGRDFDGNWHPFTREMFDTAGGDDNPSVRKLYAAPLAQSAEQDRIDAEPFGYIEPQSLEYMKDPKFAEEPESHVRLWHADNPPSRAIIPVFLAKDKK